MFGQVSHGIEVKVGAAKVWELYGTTKMALLAKEALPDAVVGVDILQGKGEVGTVMKITLAGGFSYKEKFTKVDHENRVKETEAIEGGSLDMGLSLYRVRFQVIGKDKQESCVIKSTIEYEVPEGVSFDVSIISVKLYADVAQVIKNRLTTPAGAKWAAPPQQSWYHLPGNWLNYKYYKVNNSSVPLLFSLYKRKSRSQVIFN